MPKFCPAVWPGHGRECQPVRHSYPCHFQPRPGVVLAVPEGRPRIAQHLSAGLAALESASPAGTTAAWRGRFGRPSGTWCLPTPDPALKCWAIVSRPSGTAATWAGYCQGRKCPSAGRAGSSPRRPRGEQIPKAARWGQARPTRARRGSGRPGGTPENSPALECWVGGG